MTISSNIRKRLFIVIAGSFFGVIICYKLAIKKTITLYKNLNAQQEQYQLPSIIAREINDLKTQISNQSTHSETNVNKRNKLINNIVQLSNQYNLQVLELFPPFEISDNNILIETNKIIIAGRYTDQLQLLLKLESNNKYGKVVSVKFSKILNNTTKKYELIGEFIIQNIQNT